MLPLRDLQQMMARDVLAESAGALANLIREDGLPADRRLQVYRNNTIISLTEALKATYPVVAALVGEQFFAHAAKAFIAAHPPREPRLAAYGADVAVFLAGFAPAQGLPYLPDMARLEWAMNDAYHASDDAGLTPQALSSVPQEQYAALSFQLRESCRLLRSAFRVDRIWKAHQPGHSLEGLEIAGDCHLLVYRPALEVEIMTLDAPGFALLSQLAAGATLEAAYESAAAIDAAFDLTAALGTHLARGTFSGFALPATA